MSFLQRMSILRSTIPRSVHKRRIYESVGIKARGSSIRRFVYSSIHLFVYAILLLPTVAFALTGRVVNQTRFHPEPNVAVSYIHHAEGNVTVLRDTTDAQGNFSLDLPGGIPTEPPPMLIARYNGIDYPGRLPSEGDAVEIPVFETTESDSAISLTSHHVILDANTREVTYILIVKNSGNLTYRTGGDHGHGLELQLPEGVTALTRAPEGVHLHDATLVDPRPIIPGQAQAFFSFTLPASNEILQTISYDTAQFDVFVRPSDADIDPINLHEHGPVNLGGQTFGQFAAANLTPGMRVGLRLEGSGNWEQTVLIWLVSGIALIFGIAAVILSRRAKGQKPSSQAPDRRTALLEQIADLDERFESGAIAEADHQTRRDALKAKIADLQIDRTALLEQIADLDEQFENGDLDESAYKKQREALKARIVARSNEESAR